MDVITRSRTSREEHARNSPARRRIKASEYENYLQSPLWRSNRDGALRRAGWKCERCESKRGLQVHHRTYERLGCEAASDLEVLCSICHAGHHATEIEEVQRIYLVVVADCLKRETFTTMSDLVEAVKVSCAQKHIAYDGDKVYKAIRISDASRRGIIGAPKSKLADLEASTDPCRPITKVEAREIFLQAGAVIEHLVKGWPQPVSCQEQRVRAQADEMRNEGAEPRRQVRYVGIGRHRKALGA